MFRRRRNAGEHRPVPAGRLDAGPDDAGPDYEGEFAEDEGEHPDTDVALRGEGSRADQVTGSGPWDAGAGYPQQQRIDLGSLLIPVTPGLEVQLNVAEELIVAASVTDGDSSLQVQALAAPKSGGLWGDIRDEVAEEVGNLGGESYEADGPFGTEVRARMPADPGSGLAGLEPVRFFGVDGPRWLLRGVIRGPAAGSDELARQLEKIFADIVVVRGDHPAPPRDLLEIRLPAELRQAMEQEMEQEMAQAQQDALAEQRRQYPSPFERGPEITEIR